MNLYKVNFDIGTDQLIKEINKTRRKEKDRWFLFQIFMGDKDITMKIYNTWIQRTYPTALGLENTMDMKVKDFSLHLASALKKLKTKLS